MYKRQEKTPRAVSAAAAPGSADACRLMVASAARAVGAARDSSDCFASMSAGIVSSCRGAGLPRQMPGKLAPVGCLFR